MSDIVQKLHEAFYPIHLLVGKEDGLLVKQAADEIEQLRRVLAMAHDHFLRLQDCIPKNGWAEYDMMNVLIEIRAALGEGKE